MPALPITSFKFQPLALFKSPLFVQKSSNDGTSQRSDAAAQMDAWRRVAFHYLGIVAIFSLFVNLLLLTLPIYLFQLSDRVLTSHSLDTLFMLSALALGFIGVLSMLDILRRQVLARLATTLEALLGGPVLTSIINSGRAGESGNVHLLRKLQQIRGFISSPVMLLLIDGPLAPVYFAVTFLIHPQLGWIAVCAGLLLLLIALWNQKSDRGLAWLKPVFMPPRPTEPQNRWRATPRSSMPWACLTKAS